MVEVPVGTAVRLNVYAVDEVSVSDQAAGIFSGTPDGSGTVPASIPGQGYLARYVEAGRARRCTPQHQEHLGRRKLQRGQRQGARGPGVYPRPPPDSVRDLSVGRVVPGSFAAVAHLAPGLRSLGVYLNNLGDDVRP